MGGLMGIISPLLTTSSEAASANLEGKREGNALLRAILGQQAALEEKQAQTSKLYREISKPQLGDGDTYNTAVQGEAQAKAMGPLSQAVTGAKSQQIKALAPVEAAAAGQKTEAQELGKVSAPVVAGQTRKIIQQTGAKAAEAGAKANAEVPAKIAASTGSASQNRGLAKDFHSATKAITDEAPKYAQAKTLLQEARTNPAATKSALLGFASVADQNAQLRQGIIKMIEQVDPSAGGRVDIFMSKLADGKYPAGTLNQMERVLDAVHATHRQQYEQRRAAHVARHPDQDSYVDTADEIFNTQGSAPPTTAPVGGDTAKGRTVVVNGKTFHLPHE